MDTLKQLDRLQDELYKNMILAPEALENEIMAMSQDIARRLYFGLDHKTKFEFQDRRYIAGYVSRLAGCKKHIFLEVMDYGSKKMIHVQAEVDNSCSEIENLRAVAASFLRDRAGITGVGEVED